MEIRLRGIAIPCIAQENIKAGLAVKLGPVAGAVAPRADGLGGGVQIGASLPTTAEDGNAKYVAAFRVYNEKPPIFEGLTVPDEAGNATGQPYTLRGMVKDTNMPADVTMRMVAPRLQEGQTILKGSLMLAYDNGIYTIPSGLFTEYAFAVGDEVSVASGGKWQHKSSGGKVGKVLEYANGKLTIKTGADA